MTKPKERDPQCQDRDMGSKATAAFCSGGEVTEGGGNLHFQPRIQE